jgi:DNA-directed RNA polymerase specialized sigma24 family protein
MTVAHRRAVEPVRGTRRSGARTYRELAATLAVEPATVRHRLRDGLRRLAASFAPND